MQNIPGTQSVTMATIHRGDGSFVQGPNLRLLGYPNLGQSFGQGMCGPEATGVKM